MRESSESSSCTAECCVDPVAPHLPCDGTVIGSTHLHAGKQIFSWIHLPEELFASTV